MYGGLGAGVLLLLGVPRRGTQNIQDHRQGKGHIVCSQLGSVSLSGTSKSDTERQYEVDQHVDTLVMRSKHTPSTNLLQGKLVP